MNLLKVIRTSAHGLFLDGGTLGDILLPACYASGDWKPGDMIEVFLMLDSEDRLIATTLKPYAVVDEFAWLRVVSSSHAGTFLDWGLPKDLFVPFREQKVKMLEGSFHVVRIYLDPLSNRIAATAKLDRFLDKTPARYAAGQQVALLVCARTDLGYKAIINGAHWGMMYHNQIFRPVECGQHITGFVQQVREDGKIDLTLEAPGYGKVSDVAGAILDALEKQGGFMPVTDKSSPEEIQALFGVSKKTFKQALGALYKAREITFENGGTRTGSRIPAPSWKGSEENSLL